MLCVCSVIDHRGCQNVVRTSVTHLAVPRVPLEPIRMHALLSLLYKIKHILIVSTLRDIYRKVRRICILMLGCKGFKNCWKRNVTLKVEEQIFYNENNLWRVERENLKWSRPPFFLSLSTSHSTLVQLGSFVQKMSIHGWLGAQGLKNQ